MKMDIKKVTQRQARTIRQAITDYLGTMKRIWPKRNQAYIVYQPLSVPYVESYETTIDLDTLKKICKPVELEEEPLIFHSGHYRHQRAIPTLEELERRTYKIIGHSEEGLITRWL